jgi:hypothetical protein
VVSSAEGRICRKICLGGLGAKERRIRAGKGYESMKAGSKHLGVALTWSAAEEVQGCSNSLDATRTRSFPFSWRWTKEGKRAGQFA